MRPAPADPPAPPTTDRPFDRAALESLYLRLERPLYNVVYRWVWSADDAREIVQEAFVRLWAHRARVRVETVEALTYRIALNIARNRRRWARLRRFLGLSEAEAAEPDPLPAADDALSAHADAVRVRAAVDALPEELRAIVVLAAFSELTYAEIAALTGVPEGTVGSRRNRALAQIRATLDQTARTERAAGGKGRGGGDGRS